MSTTSNSYDISMTRSNEAMILGLIFDNLKVHSAIERIYDLINAYKKDGVSRQVVTANVDFLVNALTWRLGKTERNPELIDIIRSADLVTADGMPIVWLSRLLNASLETRVTGADLVPAIAQSIEKTGHSIFLLGGKNDIAQQASETLISRFPLLNVVGVDAPFVHTEGDKMLSSADFDNAVINRINDAKPDILLIGFGNPKQELWFNRNRHKLNVAVSIGVGGTFEFIAGNVNRAPNWLQKSGFEWVYRFLQEPKRLWKRYTKGLFKLILLIAPLAFFYVKQRLSLLLKASKNNNSLSIFIDDNSKNISVILPSHVTYATCQEISHAYPNDLTEVIINYKNVKFIDINAMGLLSRLYQSNTSNIIYTSIKNSFSPQLKQLLKANHMWDIVNGSTARIKTSLYQKNTLINFNRFFTINHKTDNTTYANVGGRLDVASISMLDISQFYESMGQGHYLLILSELTFIDSTGLQFLHEVQTNLLERGKYLLLIDPPQNVKQLIKITKLNNCFSLFPSLESAEKAIKLKKEE